jgi:hypothetical protein
MKHESSQMLNSHSICSFSCLLTHGFFQGTWKDEAIAHLDGHGGEDQQVGEVAAESGEEEPQLVALNGRRRLPRVEVGERGDGDGGAGGDKREVGREHLALQVPELVPRQVPLKKRPNFRHRTARHQSNRAIDQSILDKVVHFPKIHGFWVWARTRKKRLGFERGEGGKSLLEHDDAADEGGPEGGAPGGGEGDEMGQLGGRDGAGAGAGAEEGLGSEEDARGEEADRRREPCCPPHRSPPVAGEETGGGRRY